MAAILYANVHPFILFSRGNCQSDQRGLPEIRGRLCHGEYVMVLPTSSWTCHLLFVPDNRSFRIRW